MNTDANHFAIFFLSLMNEFYVNNFEKNAILKKKTIINTNKSSVFISIFMQFEIIYI